MIIERKGSFLPYDVRYSSSLSIVIRLIFAEKNIPPKKLFLLELGPCSSDRLLASFFAVLLCRILRVDICIVLGIPIA